MKDKFNKLFNTIMQDAKASKIKAKKVIKEAYNEQYDIDVNYVTVFDTLEEIVKNADPTALKNLHDMFEKYEGSNTRQACCDIMEGDGWGAWTGLMDPENWEDMGFKLTPDQEKVLIVYNDGVNNGDWYFYEDDEVEMTKDFIIKAGGQDIVDSFED